MLGERLQSDWASDSGEVWDLWELLGLFLLLWKLESQTFKHSAQNLNAEQKKNHSDQI